jgi:hypothetical protein
MALTWLFPSLELYDERVTRTDNPDGTVTEQTELVDRRTRAVVCRIRRHFRGDGVTPVSGSETWFDGPVPKRITFERYDGGTLRKKETWDLDGNAGIAGKTVDEYERGRLRRRTHLGPSPDYKELGRFEFGYDGSERLIRITERDANGRVKRLTTEDYGMDGSRTVTVTDYSTDPATVTRTEYDASSIPQ